MESRIEHFLKDHPIDRRFRRLFMGTFSGVILLILILVFLIILFVSTNEMKKDISTLANLIGINCAAPILFNDQKAAQDILAALQAIPRVQKACILDRDHTLFAAYTNPSAPPSPRVQKNCISYTRKETINFWKNHYHLFSPIVFENKVIGKVYIESDLKRVYSRLRWVIVTAFVFFTLAILVMTFLFNKLEHAITALQESENRYRRVFENTGTAMFICQEDHTIFMVNAMFEKFINHPREDIENKIKWTDLARARHMDIQQGVDGGHFDVIWEEGPGRKKYYYAKTDFLPGTHKRIVSLIDITPIRQAEEELRKSEKLKTEFIYITSHELRTPIQSMLLGVSDLLDADEIKTNAFLREDVELVSDGVNRLARLIENLLDLSQIETDKTRLNIKDTPVHEILDTVLKETAGLAERYRHRVIVVPPEPTLTLPVDQGKIEQVFINLLGNAIKFTPEKGTIIIDCRVMPDTALFSVADNGCGIPLHAQKDIFKKFYQADVFMPDHVGGMGLGLTICQNIVQGHGGEITCISPIPPGRSHDLHLHGDRQGALFTFSLPRSRALKTLPAYRDLQGA